MEKNDDGDGGKDGAKRDGDGMGELLVPVQMLALEWVRGMGESGPCALLRCAGWTLGT